MMTKELHRPCTLWGETFDAYDTRICEINMQGSSSNFEVWVEIWDRNNCIVVKQCFSDEEIRVAQIEAITTIAEALNAPVLATKEVLVGLPKDAKVSVLHFNGNTSFGYWDDEIELWEMCYNGKHIRIIADSFRISTKDFKTLEYLLQFTLDGRRKELNDV